MHFEFAYLILIIVIIAFFVYRIDSKNYGLLSYYDLLDLVKRGVINAPMCNINSSSIDITLDDLIMIE